MPNVTASTGIIVFAGLLVVCRTPAATDVVDSQTLQQKAIDYRKAIVSGNVTMTVIVKRDANQPVYEKMRRDWTIHFQGKDLRSRCVWTRPNGTTYTYQKASTDKLYIDDTDLRGPVRVINTKGHRPVDYQLFHPRVIGMVPMPVMTLHQFGLQQCLLNNDYVPGGARGDKVGETPAWLVESSHKLYPQTKIRVWIAPQCGYGVLKLEIDSGEGLKDSAVDRIVSDYAQYGSIWFPKRVVLTREHNGQLLTHEETIVESAEFGSLASDTFSLKAFELEKGREIRVDNYLTRYWDGEGMAKYTPVRTQAADTSARWGYGVIAGLLALIGLAVTRRWFRRRQ